LSKVKQQLSSEDGPLFKDFEYFVDRHFRVYSSEKEVLSRFQNFKESRNRNKDKQTSCFADLTSEEFRQRYLETSNASYENVPDATPLPHVNPRDIPEAIDWRDHNAVTAVKQQGHCGDCFAFGTIASLEGQQAIKSKVLTSLSEQEALDCGRGDCHGGDGWKTLEALENVAGVESEEDYPYRQATDKQCRVDASKVVAKVKQVIRIASDEEEMKKAVATIGPIAIRLCGKPLNDATTGVWVPQGEENCEVNHVVAIVGYGVEGGRPYWLIKNSWGTHCGEEGYVKLIRGRNALKITTLPFYPEVQ